MIGMRSGDGRQKPAAGTRGRLITDAFKDELNDRADLAAMIGASIPLKRSGSSLVGLCPFHAERTPSFNVGNNAYHCFGCGASGRALNWLIEFEAIPFMDAVRTLAAQVGAPMPVARTDSELVLAPEPPAVDRDALYRAVHLAGAYYRHCLQYSDSTRDYLRGRIPNPAGVRDYFFGYAPLDGWRPLAEAFPDDYDESEVLKAAGLVVDKNDRRFDFFRDRLLFGIRDMRGRLIGFGGRRLQDTDAVGPKYLNTPETPIFDKSSSIFGLYEARAAIREAKRILVVEGYMDVLGLASAGIRHAVACMGTALTEAGAARLLTQAKRLVFTFDPDAAGRKATLRAASIVLPLMTAEHDVRVLTLPDGLDPDEFVLKHGPGALQDLEASAPDLWTYVMRALTEECDVTTAVGRARLKARGDELLSSIADGNIREQCALDLAGRVGGGPVADLSPGQVSLANKRFPSGVGVWAQIARAALAAPECALKLRDDIIAQLDESVQDEADLMSVLKGLEDGTAPEEGLMAEYLAVDVLEGALGLIERERLADVAATARRMYASGELTLEAYLEVMAF